MRGQESFIEIVNDEVLTALNDEMSAIDFGNAEVYVLFGHQQSDIGKANLIARLAFVAGGHRSSIVKFDGFLNTNDDGRYPSRTGHDFVVYRKFLPDLEFGGAHLILAAPFLMEFFRRFGESRIHLTFGVHVARYFAVKLFENWVQLGRPSQLFVEIGGAMADVEVEAYVVPAIRLLQNHRRLSLFLLVEAGFNGQDVKARRVVDGVEAGVRRGLRFDVVFVRLPAHAPQRECYRDVECYIGQKIVEAGLRSSAGPTVLCIPFFHDAEMVGYVELLSKWRQTILKRCVCR